MKSKTSQLLAALSLSHMLFIQSWRGLSNYDYFFYFSNPPSSMTFLAIITNVVTLAIAIFFILRLKFTTSHKSIKYAANFLLILGILLALNGSRSLFPNLSIPILLGKYDAKHVFWAAGLLFMLFTFVFVRWIRHVEKAAFFIFLFLVPFSLIDLGIASYKAITLPAENKIFLANPSHSQADTRVLVILFDELDGRISFFNRPDFLKLENFDKFKKTSVFAQAAFSPAKNTLRSIPSLLTGSPIAKAKHAGPSDLQVKFNELEEAPTSWPSVPNLFTKIQNLNMNVAAVGWYLPYCRLFPHVFITCQHYGFGDFASSDQFWPSIKNQLKDIAFPKMDFFRLYIANKLGWNWIRNDLYSENVERYKATHQESLKVAVDPRISFAFLHYSVPHPPYIFNRTTKELTAYGDADYFGNVELADRSLGDIMRKLEESGLDKKTAVLVLSDHWFRQSQETKSIADDTDKRIVYMWHLPNQNSEVTVEKGINSLITLETVMQLLSSAIKNEHELAHWLEKNSKINGPINTDDNGEF